jgi:hypothetical protein
MIRFLFKESDCRYDRDLLCCCFVFVFFLFIFTFNIHASRDTRQAPLLGAPVSGPWQAPEDRAHFSTALRMPTRTQTQASGLQRGTVEMV